MAWNQLVSFSFFSSSKNTQECLHLKKSQNKLGPLKEAHGTDGAAGAPWGGVTGAAGSHGGMLPLAARHGWVFVELLLQLPLTWGWKNHSAE